MGLIKFNENALIVPLTAWDDSQVPSTTVRTGVVAPTLATGFRGNAAFQMLNFVNSQADEVQFTVQLPHSRKISSDMYPHVHFVPSSTASNGTYNVKFILEYYAANIGSQFPSEVASYEMTYQFTVATNNHIWKHLMAANETALSNTFGISSILFCRLYRDNTVTSNFPGNVALAGFDIHIQIDSPGSDQPSSKSF